MDELGLAAAGAALALSATGSALGTGYAGMAAIGAWKKNFAQNKAAPFLLVAFVGAPLSQTIYGFILMNSVFAASQQMAQNNAPTVSYLFLMFAAIFGGVGIGASAAMQGKAAAAASDALAETGKGFGNYIMVLGIIETVALFTMIFLLVTIGNLEI
ncbi:MAG: V-type ATP synthase subunit K [Fibrobacter sp.]|nr:V-type ATP synthase subunit K [Fibrobacter sp.]